MIARKSALIIITQLANGILGFIGLKFIAMYLTPWEYGVIGFAYGFVAIFSIFGMLGFDNAHIKRVSEGKDLGTCIATFAVTKLSLAGLMATIVFIAIWIWKFLLHRGFESPLHEKAIWIMLSYFILLILAQIFISTFTARKEIAKARIPYFLYTLGRISATIFVLVNGYGVLAVAYTYLLGEILHFSYALYLFRGYPVGKPSFEYFKSYASFAVHAVFGAIPWLIMSNIDKVIIQLFWTAQEVGNYFAIFNLSRFFVVFATAISTLLMPTVSELHAKNRWQEIERVTLESERYLSMIAFIIIFSMIGLAKPVIHILLSDKYMKALPILQILPLFVLFDILARPYQSQLQGMDMPQYTKNRVLLMLATQITLDLILVPKDIKSLGIKLFGLGATGAAIATVIAYFVGYVYIRVAAWKETGIKGRTSILWHITSALIVALLLRIVSPYIGRWYELLGISLLGLGIYVGILSLIGEFTRKDYDLFMDTLNIKKMIRYVIDELRGKNE